MRFHKENVLGVLIDVQERLFPHIHQHQYLAERIAILIQGLKILEIPLMMTEQYVKGLGKTIPELQKHTKGVECFEKITFSCCGNEDFIEALIQTKKKEIILFGIETHVCVQQTFLDMLNRGLTVIIVADCVSSRKQYDKEIALERMRQEGARITTREALLFELCQTAGTDSFKQISKLVK